MSKLRSALVFLFSIWLVGCSSASTPATTAPLPTMVVEPTVIPTAEATLQPTELVVTEPAEPTAPETSAPITGEGSLLPETLAEIDSFLNSAYGGQPFQGSVLVARNGQVLLRKGVGLADQSAGIPNEPETKFRLGSLTKPFTAVAVLMLYHQGLLDLDDPLCLYLENCPPAWQAITNHYLLVHTSGIVDIVTLDDYASFKTEATTPLQTMARLTDLPLDFVPGEQWMYSNSNYIVLSAIIERVSGQRYEAFVEAHIFAPLGMANSGYDHNNGETAIGYLPDGSTAEYIDMSLPDAAGGLYSTVDDLYRFDRALYTDQLLPTELIELMFTAQATITPNDPYTGYGYGWIIFADPDEPPPGKAVGHNGSIEGFSTAMLRFVEQDAVVIVLGNVEKRNPTLVAQTLAERLLLQ
ncbi:MAG: beta-lactamase family protein [Caldilineaceae bacterium]|nr:beta-lactamase family protein [Caldilineaceae bacterium]